MTSVTRWLVEIIWEVSSLVASWPYFNFAEGEKEFELDVWQTEVQLFS